jgi:hypothetical protein
MNFIDFVIKRKELTYFEGSEIEGWKRKVKLYKKFFRISGITIKKSSRFNRGEGVLALGTSQKDYSINLLYNGHTSLKFN